MLYFVYAAPAGFNASSNGSAPTPTTACGLASWARTSGVAPVAVSYGLMSLTLNDLQPYTQYEFNVVAVSDPCHARACRTLNQRGFTFSRPPTPPPPLMTIWQLCNPLCWIQFQASLGLRPSTKREGVQLPATADVGQWDADADDVDAALKARLSDAKGPAARGRSKFGAAGGYSNYGISGCAGCSPRLSLPCAARAACPSRFRWGDCTTPLVGFCTASSVPRSLHRAFCLPSGMGVRL